MRRRQGRVWDGQVEVKKGDIGKRGGKKTIPRSFLWHFKPCL